MKFETELERKIWRRWDDGQNTARISRDLREKEGRDLNEWDIQRILIDLRERARATAD